MSIQKFTVDLTSTGTTPLFPVGQNYVDEFGREWQYVKASEAIAINAYVKVSTDSNFTVLLADSTNLPATEPAEVGCAQVAIASGSYGWVFRGPGYHVGKFAASCVHNVKILSTATDGVFDDAGTVEIGGLKLIATITDAAAAPAWATRRLATAI